MREHQADTVRGVKHDHPADAARSVPPDGAARGVISVGGARENTRAKCRSARRGWRRGPLLALALIATFSGTASAQEVADTPPKVQQIEAVERGWFLQADVGLTVFVNEVDNRRYAPGPQIGVFLGYDILPILNLGVGVTFWGGEVDDGEDTPLPTGDLFYVAPMLRAQVALVTTERNFLWVRGDVGFGFGMPTEIDGVEYAGNAPVFGVTAGFERFTKLRHFAIGIHGGVVIVTDPGLGVGVTITPTLKYTF